MESLFLLIPLSSIIITICAVILLWAVRSGQYDDLKGAANRILMEEDTPLKEDPLQTNQFSEGEETDKPRLDP
jgi:cbb3-type cytochrome oxidase maturation protein